MNSTDSQLVLKYAVDHTVPINPLNADANGDKQVNATDADLILKASVGSIQITCGR